MIVSRRCLNDLVSCKRPVGKTKRLLSSFRINTCKSLSKQTTLTPFRMNTCEKRGEGGSPRQGTLLRLRSTVTTNPRPPAPAVRRATLLYFVFVMYSYTTGGPFGLE